MKAKLVQNGAVAGLAALIAAAPAAAFAQPSSEEGLPSYARPEESIRGRIVSVAEYSLNVRDDRGNLDRITLHDGTVINPSGLKLAAGMAVTIEGYQTGGRFEAIEIDTQYTSYPAPGYAPPYPPYAFYGPPYWGPPYWGPPYWGPAFSIGFGFSSWGFGVRGRYRWR